MTDVLQCLAGLALCVFGLYRWSTLRAERRGAAQRYVHRFAFCLGAALVVLAPATARAVEDTFALPGLPMLAGDLLRIAAVACMGLVTARSVQRQLITAGLMLLALVLLFSAAHIQHASGELFVDIRHRPFLVAYNTTITLYPAWHAAALCRASLHRSRRADGALRIGLRLLCAGAAAGVVWTAWGFDDIRLALFTGRQTDGEDGVSAVLGLLCAALLIAGGSTAAWSALRHWWWSYRTYRALAPLWSALYRSFPEIALLGPRRGFTELAPRAVGFALYRRVIEIHDGLLLLRPHLRAPSPTEPDSAATARAASILAALDRATASPPAPDLACPPPLLGDGAAIGTDAEAAQLAAVSRAFAQLTGSGPHTASV
ncbi:MAB_1171c family putative transporter [Streptomyces sp. NPDC050516]|uniref:MAB_1171c family putative transporter n=1 Tax=Streptomyces sp. NPDC050516 TaxID=3365621 RepID=UPI0037A6D069